MADNELPLEELLERLEALVRKSLHLWEMPAGATARLINVSENATYLVEAPGGYRSILRVHRANYHSRRAIECELAWIAALDASGAVVAPGHYLGRDGEAIQQAAIEGLDAPRYMVLFHFVEGSPPDENGDLRPGFAELGEIAAHTHIQSAGWQRPDGFERPYWDIEQFFGARPTWGDWRDAPEVTAGVRAVLEEVQRRICARLEAFGRGPDRYGLIHADMRLANLLEDETGTRLIDFDDCGIGWFLYDFATGISFMEDDPRVPALKQAWVEGYRKVRPLSPEEEAELDTFVMLRRMALLAWIGSHIEAPEPQALAPGFARVTAELGRAWLARSG
ncbi:phosphotransferase enzyme family protein [Acidimangrovimonas pyrenivorans]|uniref:Phosphotransferase enzyme family protein n=1 Tax=Acidimangrovimonas pyrenivorans TaxID=2030798 RepID=A0ABV7AG33_9RHOB